MSWSPHVTVAVVVERNDQYLLVEEKTVGVSHLVYNQPAGHVEAGESLVEAAMRETREETNWNVEITDLLGIYSYTPPAAPECTYYRFCFVAKCIAQVEHGQIDSDIHDVVWLTLEQLQLSARARSPLVVRAIMDYQSGKRYPLSMIYEHPFSHFSSALDA